MLYSKRTAEAEFRASVKDDGVLECLVYEEIGADYWSGGGITAKTVKQQIDAAGAYSKISLRINSPGGDAFEGVAIGNLLKSTGKPIDVYVDGVAASAASIIAMCGDTITMAPNALMMIHDAWTFCMGNAAELTKMAATLSKVDEAIAQTYVDRTGKPVDEVKVLMDAETWMSAKECVDGGFATAIAAEDDGAAMAMARKFKALARMKNLPEQLKPDKEAMQTVAATSKVVTPPSVVAVASETTSECACPCDPCVDGTCNSCTHEACDCQNCEDCPMAGVTAESNLSLYEARAKRLTLSLPKLVQ